MCENCHLCGLTYDLYLTDWGEEWTWLCSDCAEATGAIVIGPWPVAMRVNDMQCVSCGDPCGTGLKFKKQYRCAECYAELRFGKIPIVTHPRETATSTAATMEDDGGPWQQNAVREMEDAAE